MATNPASTPVPTNPADQQLDDHSGVYGFFRRHQKKLLYTAGLFTLLTFSVTGPMMTAVGSIFEKQRDTASIRVGGQQVKLEAMDYQIGSQLAHNVMALPLGVLPRLGVGDGGSNELGEILAILRRAAITEGVDVSMVEVDRAIEATRDMSSVESAARLAGYRGFSSLAAYRELVREAMRVGTYVRLQTLAVDSSDADVLERAIADREKVTFRVAAFDEKAAEERIKAESKPTDDELKAWLDGKNDFEKTRLQAFDTNHLELRFGALLLGDGQFDAAQWADVLKDFQPAEDMLLNVYEQEKELRFKLEGDNNYKPLAEVQPVVTRMLQADKVMQHLFAELKKRLEDTLKAPTEALQVAQTSAAEARQRVQELEAQLAAAKPEEQAALEESMRLAKETLTAKDAAVTAAKDAVDAARTGWDFPAAFAELTKDKTGFEQKAMSGRQTIEQLKDLDAAGVGYGKWSTAPQANRLSNKGDFCPTFARAEKAFFVYQATDVLVRPLKPWDTLKPLLEGAYYTEKAKTEGETKKKAMEDALLRLAKEKMADKVQEIEGKRTAKIDGRMVEWTQTTGAAVAEARDLLQRLEVGTQAQIAWQRKLDRLTAQLAESDKQRAQFETEVGAEIDAEIAAEAQKHYGAVLDAAAAEAGFTVATVGPHPRDLPEEPRFDKAYDETTVFLFRNHGELEAGATTGMVQDATNRRWLVAVCEKVEPLTAADLTRRLFEAWRRATGTGLNSYSSLREVEACAQAFTLEALTKRYDLKRTVGAQEVQ